MVKKVNKKEFIDTLSKSLSYTPDKCILINDILENNFFISKKNKGKIIEEFILKLNVQREEAEIIYDTAIKIIKDELKHKLRYPLENQD